MAVREIGTQNVMRRCKYERDEVLRGKRGGKKKPRDVPGIYHTIHFPEALGIIA
jgi:hypothetical protein